MIFVGDDWAEAHHDVCVLDEQGARLAKQRLPEGLVASRSCMRCWLSTRLSRARSWSRDRHAVWGAKSDPGDARVLADLVRTDRRQHRVVAAVVRGNPRSEGDGIYRSRRDARAPRPGQSGAIVVGLSGCLGDP